MNTCIEEIFNKRFYDVLTGEPQEQFNFLKIFPIYKKRKDILQLWKNIYVNTASTDKNMESIINFIVLAFEYNLIDYNATDVYSLLSTMKEYNCEKIEEIKESIINGRSYTNNKKMLGPISFGGKSNIKSIKEISPKDMALEITRIFSDLVKNINYHELIIASSDDTKIVHGPINLLIDYFHKLSYIVLFTILIEDKTESDRIRTVKHILKIGDELKHLHNYHGLFALVSSLNNTAIQRLDNLWKFKNDNFIELTNIIDPSKNYKNYRNLMKKNIKMSTIPYIGIIITDIKHALECPLYDIDNDNFNMTLYNMIINLLDNFKNIQVNYKIEKNEQIMNWFLSINTVYDDNYFYNVSNAIKSSVHKDLIEQINVKINVLTENLSCEDSITQTLDIPKSVGQPVHNTDVHDSVEELIRLSPLPHQNKRKHLSDRSYLNKKREDNGVVKSWTVNEVQVWLRSIGLECYCDIFLKEDIDGIALYHLTNDVLKNDMQINVLGHRLKIMALGGANIK